MQLLLSGLTVGALYGAIGMGYVIVHRLTGMVNFAMGDIAAAGGFGAVVLSGVVPPFVAILGGAVIAALVSVAMYHAAISTLQKHGLMVQTIVTLGVSIIIRSALLLLFGTDPSQFDPITGGDALNILGGHIIPESLWVIGLAVVGWLGLTLFFDRTLSGKALSAFSVNAYAAQVVGISLPVMATIAFAFSGGIAGLVLAAQTPTSSVTADIGVALGLQGFMAAILGGFEDLRLTLAGGFLIGIVSQVVARFVSSQQQWTILFALLIVLLIVRPQGLTRKVVSDRV